MSTEALVKQDINFLEYPLWFQDGHATEVGENGYLWEDREGFIYRAGYKPPIKTDAIFLMYLMLRCQSEGWASSITLTRFEILKACGMGTSKQNYDRLADSLARWKMVGIEFEGTYYTGSDYITVNFGIVDAWELNHTTKELTVHFSPFWIKHVRSSTYFKLLDFEQIKAFTSPLASRLYELLIKTFQGRSVWKIDAKKLAVKMTMPETSAGHIVRRIKSAVKQINARAELQLKLEVDKPRRGKAILTFRRVSEASSTDTQSGKSGSEPLPTQQRDPLEELLDMAPAKPRKQKGVRALLARALKKYEFEYIQRNVMYTNKNYKRSYRGYLDKSLKHDWGGDWWLEQTDVKTSPLTPEPTGELFQPEASEFEKVVAEFVALRSQEEFVKIQEHVEAQCKELPEEYKETQIQWQIISLLEKGIKHYQQTGKTQ